MERSIRRPCGGSEWSIADGLVFDASLVEVDDPIDQPGREGVFPNWASCGSLLVAIGVDQHAIDGLGLHRLEGVGDDRGQSFSYQFRPGVSGEFVGGLEGESNPSASMWNLSQSGQKIWNRLKSDRQRALQSADLPSTPCFADRAMVGHRRCHDQDVMCRPLPLQC